MNSEYSNTISDKFVPDAFILGTGTGGTLMGTGKYLKEKWPYIKIIAIEPAESPVMSGGEPGLHGIQGIGATFVEKIIGSHSNVVGLPIFETCKILDNL